MIKITKNMKINFFLIFGLIALFSCNSAKKITGNTGIVNVGNNNFVINFPEVDSIYTSKEISRNILFLQRELNKTNEQILENSPQSKKQSYKFEEADTLASNEFNINNPVNQLKMTREQIFQALKAWENLLYSQNRRSLFFDEKSRLLKKYENINDSLLEDSFRLYQDNKKILDSLISTNITSSKIDSLLRQYLFEDGAKLPYQGEFVKEVNAKNYQRMLTLRDEDLDILEKGKKPYDIKFANNTSNKIYIAVRYFAYDGQWVVSGWYTVDPQSTTNLSLYAKKSDFYFYAKAEAQNLYYGDGPSFFVASDQAFTIVEKYSSDLYKEELKPFFRQRLNINNENRVVFAR